MILRVHSTTTAPIGEVLRLIKCDKCERSLAVECPTNGVLYTHYFCCPYCRQPYRFSNDPTTVKAKDPA